MTDKALEPAPDYHVFYKTAFEENLEFAQNYRRKERELFEIAHEEMRNILLEPTTKDNVSAKVALYKDLAKRHVIDNPQVSLQYVENKVEQSNNEKSQDIIVPPPLDVEELSRRAVEALEAYEESKRWKQQVLENKKQQQINE